MSRLEQAFSNKRKEGRACFIPFLTAGFPDIAATIPILLSLEKGGADVIELGVPFTDPLADGPVIQKASNVALKAGVTVAVCLQMVKDARAAGLKVPVILMGYYNPFRAFGEKRLIEEASRAGADGFIVVDYPPEESGEFRNLCRAHQLSYIPLIAPTTSDERIAYLTSLSDSFIYCISLLGVTGGRAELPKELPAFIQRIRTHTTRPLAIGFGISTREQFDAVAKLGDAVVVGSTIIKAIDGSPAGDRVAAIERLARSFTSPADQAAAAAVLSTTATPPTNGTGTAARPPKPDSAPSGRFGDFGGRFAPETLIGALEELEQAYARVKDDPQFQKELATFSDYIGRPTPLYHAERLSKEAGGAQIWLKREDLCHTGAHKINNAVGQALLALRLGKKRIIAETGAGQHGVATATICAKLGLECHIAPWFLTWPDMGTDDIERQSLNVFRMKLMGATVVPVSSGSRTLKDAINEAMRDWVTNIRTTHYLVGSAIGPHPFPTIVRDFQSIIGREARSQFLARNGRLPDVVMACVGGGSNAIGLFHPFIGDASVKIVGVEAAGAGLQGSQHCATCVKGTPGVLHGTRTLLLQDGDGQILSTHSISAGLDYPGVGPEHAWLKESGRGQYVAVTDAEALQGFSTLAKLEGILAALESSHAIYHAIQAAKALPRDAHIVVCLSGRGDKDMATISQHLSVTLK